MSRRRIDHRIMTRDVIKLVIAGACLAVMFFLLSMCNNPVKNTPNYYEGGAGEGYSKNKLNASIVLITTTATSRL